jgi:hypothetical protein
MPCRKYNADCVKKAIFAVKVVKLHTKIDLAAANGSKIWK